MIPLRVTVPSRGRPIATLALIAINVAVFLYELSLPDAAQQNLLTLYGLVPARLSHAVAVAGPPAVLTIFTSMFLHGGWLHIIGNMWFLWLFGDNVEERFGHLRFVLFYLLCGVAAAGTQCLVSRGSTEPMIGASGAISGVMGAYLLLYPRAGMTCLVPLVFTYRIVVIPAFVYLGFWFLAQLYMGSLASGTQKADGSVAFWAHVGGFVAGMALLPLFLLWRGHSRASDSPAGDA